METGVSEEMVKAAQADLKKQAKKSDVRTYQRGAGTSDLYISDIYPLPAEFDLEGLAPTGYLAQPEGAPTGSIETQPFRLIEERLNGLVFDKPARRLEQGRTLRVVKALKPNGNLAQLPFEGQINNTAAGDVSDAIGLKKYERKGFIVFFNYETLQPVYCMARNCWAAAMIAELAKKFPEHVGVIGSGYCCFDHMAFTEPNLARQGGMFETGVTTTRSRRG